MLGRTKLSYNIHEYLHTHGNLVGLVFDINLYLICVYYRLTLWTACIINSATVRCNAVYCSVCAWFKQSYSLYNSGTEWNWEIHSHIVSCNFPRQIIIYFHFKQTKHLLVQKSPICQGRYGLFDSGMKGYDEICSTWADVNFNDQCWEHGNLSSEQTFHL